MPPCATYQQHLRTLEQGLPVWDPSPKNSLEIIPGSVLYPGISGTFSVLFNARKSADDTHWQPHGVPRGFRTLDEEFGPLVVDGPRTVVGLRGWNCIGVECTREVSGGLDIGVPAGAAPMIAAGGGFKLTCREASGALLALKHDPITTYIESSAHVVSYMMRHHASWLELANSQARPGLGLGLKLEDLYFVTGTTKVPQWFIGVFEGTTERERGARLECTVTDVFSLNAEVTDIRTIHRTPILKKGPTQRNMTMSIDRELPWDQCIFLHYFKMKKRVLIAPKVIRAASGSDRLPESEPDNDAPILLVDVFDDDVEVEFEEESGRSKIVDPVNELLDYILEYSDADVAVASDKDVDALFNEIPQDTRAALCDLSPKVVVDEHGAGRICLEPSSSNFVRDVQAGNGDPGELFGQVRLSFVHVRLTRTSN
ncbi:hypothetical protein L226DRAFT_49262 [Lentinus tigrinus ALCF2SS1-7]|uniref:uncharacterized protein n=1 Tax=Lentinus tigrinus ALCF2SS1-7 TaxID=1328758 RepID=UPI00116610FE|nr:hypothetical protein L226DRAFT_49262 [Lentinus tigrinus ALCF2SS1-7]